MAVHGAPDLIAGLAYLVSLLATIAGLPVSGLRSVARRPDRGPVHQLVLRHRVPVADHKRHATTDAWARLGLCPVAVMSLTGFGRSLPGKWVESIEAKLPDYVAGRQTVANLAAVIRRTRRPVRAAPVGSQAVSQAAKKYLNNIETNQPVAPA